MHIAFFAISKSKLSIKLKCVPILIQDLYFINLVNSSFVNTLNIFETKAQQNPEIIGICIPIRSVCSLVEIKGFQLILNVY